MKFRHELSYEATPDAVFAMLADPAFREAACHAQDVASVEVELTPSGSGFALVIDQVQRTTDLPSFARAFAGETSQAIQRESWSDATGGTLVIEAPGKPTSVSGTISLQARGAGTVEVVELEIKAKVPLVGGKIEKLLGEKIAQGMDIEHQVGQAWLKGERA